MFKWKFVDNGCESYISRVKSPSIDNEKVFDTFEEAKQHMTERADI